MSKQGKSIFCYVEGVRYRVRINPLNGKLAVCEWVGTEYGFWNRIRNTYPQWSKAIQAAHKVMDEEEQANADGSIPLP